MKGYIYQSFWFKNEIKKHFYAGSKFETYKPETTLIDSVILAKDMVNDKESFMPELVKKMEWLIGQGNFIYDYWEFGDDDFSIYWFIKKEVYLEKMKLIQQWVEFEEFKEICFFNIHDPEKEETLEDEEFNFKSGIYNDDGTYVDVTKLPIPNLCKSCKTFQSDFWEDNLLCNLNRNDQRNEDDFECGAYEQF
jgi:hypothetical protein